MWALMQRTPGLAFLTVIACAVSLSLTQLVAAHRIDFNVALAANLAIELGMIAIIGLALRFGATALGKSMAEVATLRAEVQSLFDENPDAITVYNREGFVLRTNRARCELLGVTIAESIGRHYLTFIEPASRPKTLEVFERANNGERVIFDTVLKNGTGTAINVQMSAFPNLVDGIESGVIAVSRDVRDLRLAQAQSHEMSLRLTTLCEIAAGDGGDWRSQIVDALALAAGHLSCSLGFVAEIAQDTATILSTLGAPESVQPGLTLPLNETLSQFIIASDDVWVVDDLRASPWHDFFVSQQTAWRGMVAVKIGLNGSTFGTLAIATAQPRCEPLSARDRVFLKMVAALIGSIIDRRRQNAKLDGLAFTDTLTGLPNRCCILDKLHVLVAATEPERVSFAIHFIDLDGFKQVNDRGGHHVGDAVLRDIAARFAHCIRATDTVARLGGDEFLVLQPMIDSPKSAGELARRLTKTAQEPFWHEGVCYHLGCSVGISIFPTDGNDAETLLKRADEAMYRAKTIKAAQSLGASISRRKLDTAG
jgi:diguanylate cyclase (GGDEF)-like protein/PAS domain S-box-containing protein